MNRKFWAGLMIASMMAPVAAQAQDLFTRLSAQAGGRQAQASSAPSAQANRGGGGGWNRGGGDGGGRNWNRGGGNANPGVVTPNTNRNDGMRQVQRERSTSDGAQRERRFEARQPSQIDPNRDVSAQRSEQAQRQQQVDRQRANADRNDNRRDGSWRDQGRNDANTQNRAGWRGNDRSNWDRANNNRGDLRAGSRRIDDRQRWSSQRRWDNGWRNDRRYDWRSYRNANRAQYRLSPYYAPRGWDYGYRRFGIGISLSSLLFANNYWIDDPYAYRLPPAYGTLRWVRYYDDALLVDIRDGYVVDVIYDFFD